MRRYLLTLALCFLVLPFQPSSPAAAGSNPPFDCSAMEGAVAGKVISYTTRVKFQGRSQRIKLELLPCWAESSDAYGTPAVQLGFARRLSGFDSLEGYTGTSASVTVREGSSTRFRGTVGTEFDGCSASVLLGYPRPYHHRSPDPGPYVANAQVLEPISGIEYFKAATAKRPLPVKHSVTVSYKFCGKTLKSPALEFIVP